MKTDITIVLDRSGSMQSIQSDTIGGVNRFIEEQQAVPGEANFSLFQFDHEFETINRGVPLKDARKLSKENYVPRGNTCLFGAVGESIRETGDRLKTTPEKDRPEKVVFVIVTDGEENSSHIKEWSRKHTASSIRDAIKHQSDVYKWEFVYIGANQDAFKNATDIGIKAGNALNYSSNKEGTEKLYGSLSANLRSMRCMSKVDMSWEVKQRKEQEEALKP